MLFLDEDHNRLLVGMNQLCAIQSNAVVNSFLEHNKLTLSNSKCHKIHCGKKSVVFPELKVRMESMHKTEEEKYLGEYINKIG